MAGYLPYNIVGGWQQLVKDFAYWRILVAAMENDPGLSHGVIKSRQCWGGSTCVPLHARPQLND